MTSWTTLTSRSRATDDGESTVVADDETAGEDDARAASSRGRARRSRPPACVRRPRRQEPGHGGVSSRSSTPRAEKLVAGVIPPGRLYLVASGGLRKGSGSFYTRPALSVPLAQRALEPLCYERTGIASCRGRPRRSSTSRSASRRWARARSSSPRFATSSRLCYQSLEHHGRIKPKETRDGRDAAVREPCTGEEPEELLPLPPEDDRFAEAALASRPPRRRAMPLRRRPQPDGRRARAAGAVGRDARSRAAVRVPRSQAQGRQLPRRVLARMSRTTRSELGSGRRATDERRAHKGASGAAEAS